jgi:methionyl-tRNA formyltransferase
MKNTRIVFFGSSDIGAGVLSLLISHAKTVGYEIVGVITNKDTQSGRNMQMIQNDVKQVALKHDIPVGYTHDPIVELLTTWKADLGVVYSYGAKIKNDILGYFEDRDGMLNIHTSYLPVLRGSIPVQMAIFSGWAQTGVSIVEVVEAWDGGPILAQEKVAIEDTDNQATLTKKMYEKGVALLLKYLPEYVAGESKFVPQDESQATFCYIKDLDTIRAVASDYLADAKVTSLAVRALAPYERLKVAFDPDDDHRYEFLLGEVDYHDNLDTGGMERVGDMYSQKENKVRKVYMKCKKGYLELILVQPIGKKMMSASDFWNGYIKN